MGFPTREEIEELYVQKKMTKYAVARVLKCRNSTVIEAVALYGLQREPRHREIKVGEKFELLEVVGYDDNNKHRPICRCQCGNERWYHACNLRKSRHFSCGCERYPRMNRSKGYTFDGIRIAWWNSLKKNAYLRGYEFAITKEYALQLLKSQNYKCALSGVPIRLATGWKSGQSASIDRIRNNKGYIEGNIQWVHSVINIMKNAFVQEDFINWCRRVASTHPGHTEEFDNSEKYPFIRCRYGEADKTA